MILANSRVILRNRLLEYGIIRPWTDEWGNVVYVENKPHFEIMEIPNPITDAVGTPDTRFLFFARMVRQVEREETEGLEQYAPDGLPHETWNRTKIGQWVLNNSTQVTLSGYFQGEPFSVTVRRVGTNFWFLRESLAERICGWQ